MVIKYITLYYDSYEKTYGDGFYPSTTFVKGYESILTGFKNADGCWKQVTGDPITGFDGNERNNVLNLLNDERYRSNHILDSFGYLI
jgi:hypothetical protein